MPLIILAHPRFDQSLANKTIIEELHRSGLDLVVRNIISLYPDYRIDPKAEQEILLQHKTIVFQYPFYWYNMPAILKHWFDIVFEYQFAYGSKGDKLEGKNFVPSFTVGAPENGYHTLSEHHFRIMEFCKNLEQTAYYSKMNYIDPVYFHGTSLNAGNTERQVTDRARDHAQRLIESLSVLESPSN